MADPNLFQELLENQSFRLAIRDTREAVANAETFINYLETTGYDKLKEAGESVDREVCILIEIKKSCFTNFFYFLVFSTC